MGEQAAGPDAGQGLAHDVFQPDAVVVQWRGKSKTCAQRGRRVLPQSGHKRDAVLPAVCSRRWSHRPPVNSREIPPPGGGAMKPTMLTSEEKAMPTNTHKFGCVGRAWHIMKLQKNQTNKHALKHSRTNVARPRRKDHPTRLRGRTPRPLQQTSLVDGQGPLRPFGIYSVPPVRSCTAL